MNGEYDLTRFVKAQAGVYETALAELRRGRKESHWMWFVFPQIAGLGRSAMAQRYAISNMAEARSYLAHAALGARLRECSEALLAASLPMTCTAIMGEPDDMKLRSSMTLFDRVEGGGVFARVLEKYFAGEKDGLTLDRLDSGPEGG